ncbi:MAG: sigma-70 family RNA polymerase sigma factor [Bacteroidales bacterium]
MKRNDPKEQEFIARVEEHQGILHKIVFLYAGNRSDREDLMQEITLQLWKSYGSFRGESSFSTWMYRVALNTAISATKKAPWTGDRAEPRIPSFDPDASMDASEEIRILYRAIAQLNKIDRAVILLWLDQIPYREIADTMGLSEKNVSVKLVRIKARLATLIEKLQGHARN